jgi:hypothetical protein
VIILLALFWYGLVPIGGALVSRQKWRRFRAGFDRLRFAPILDYRRYVSCGKAGEENRLFRFTGGFESITGGRTLWVRGMDLTIPVSLAGAQIYTLPSGEGGGEKEYFDPGEEAPQRLRWDRVATLTEDARVFVGGELTLQDDRWTFALSPGVPLQVIIYEGSDRSMAIRAIRAGRRRNEYWNPITPYALALGASCLIAVAVMFLPRPAFRLTAITAFAAVFIPLFPLVPPGLLLTIVYRRLSRQARIFRACRDLARLPLAYTGDSPYPAAPEEIYGCRCYEELPEGIPILVPGIRKPKKEPWYVFGVMDGEDATPQEPADHFATFGAIPGDPEKLARKCNRSAYTLEISAWFLLVGSIGLNALFIALIVTLL